MFIVCEPFSDYGCKSTRYFLAVQYLKTMKMWATIFHYF